MPKTGVSCLKKVLVHLVEHRNKKFPQQMKEIDCEVLCKKELDWETVFFLTFRVEP